MTTLSPTETVAVEYAENCPTCGRAKGFADIGSGIWGYCKTHRTKWIDSFRTHYEDSEERMLKEKRIYDEIGLGAFEYCGADVINGRQFYILFSARLPRTLRSVS